MITLPIVSDFIFFKLNSSYTSLYLSLLTQTANNGVSYRFLTLASWPLDDHRRGPLYPNVRLDWPFTLTDAAAAAAASASATEKRVTWFSLSVERKRERNERQTLPIVKQIWWRVYKKREKLNGPTHVNNDDGGGEMFDFDGLKQMRGELC